MKEYRTPVGVVFQRATDHVITGRTRVDGSERDQRRHGAEISNERARNEVCCAELKLCCKRNYEDGPKSS